MAERRRSSTSPVRQDDAYHAARCSEVVLQLRRDFDARDRLYRYTDQVLWSTYPVRIPEAYKATTQEIRSPLALNIAQTIAASLSVNPAQVHFEPLSGTQPGQLNAEHRQAFFEASWKRQEQEAGRQLLRLFIWSLVSKGEGILKTIERSKAAWRGYTAFSKELLKRLDDTADEEYGELARGGDEAKKQGAYDRATERFKEGAPYPISSTDVPPDTFYYWRTLDGLRVAAELVEVPYLEALDRYGAGLDTDGNVTRYESLGLPRSEWESVMSGGTTLTLEEVWEWDVCFPGETRVAVDSPLRAVSRRRYVGELVEVTTASGHQFAATPNHPILTPDGWVAAGTLREGGEVVRYVGVQGEAAGHPDDVEGQPTLEEVYRLCAEARVAERHRGHPMQFHGDGQQGQVDVVAVDGELWHRLEPTLAQPRGQRALALADDVETVLAPHGLLVQPLRDRGTATRGAVSGLGDGLALGGAHAGGAQALGVRDRAHQPQAAQALRDGGGGTPNGGADDDGRLAGLDVAPPQLVVGQGEPVGPLGPRGAFRAPRDTVADEALADGARPDAEGLGDDLSLLGLEHVAAVQIVTVRRRAFAGDVYNLHTAAQRYSAGGIVAHNCHYVLSGPGQRIDGTGTGTARRPGTLVKNPIKHGYGDRYLKVLRGPYFHALGSTTASRLPERAGLSILFPFLSLFPALDSYLTMQSNAAYQTGYAAFKRSQPSGMALASTLGGAPNAPFGLEGVEPDALASQLQTIEPGTIYPFDVQPIDQPKTGADLDKIIGAVRGFIELALPSVVQGVMADSSGYAINQAAHLARLAWDPIVGNAETALSQRTGFESWLIQHKVGETVYAWSGGPGSGGRLRRTLATAQKGPSGWLGVGPDDLRGAHRYTDTLDPDVPSNKALDVQMHESMVRNNFESVEQAIEALGGDPGETERQIIVANVKKSPPVQDRLMKRIEQQLGFIDAKTLAQIGAGPDGAPQLPPELAAMLAAGQAGPPGNGTIPGSAPGQAPPGPGGPAGPGGGLGPLGPQVFAPGVNMPMAPTPGGSVTGGGPPARAGNAPGSPWQPSNPPAGGLPLPGQ